MFELPERIDADEKVYTIKMLLGAGAFGAVYLYEEVLTRITTTAPQRIAVKFEKPNIKH